MASKRFFLGLDVGGTKSGVCIGDKDGKIISSVKFPTRTDQGFPRTLELIKEKIHEVLASNHLTVSDLREIGVSCGGPLDAKKGIVHSPPNLPGWDDIHITELLEKEFKVPCYLQNDAKAGALAEWRWGAGKGTKNMVFCTMGTGFGSGLILDGKLYEGANGMAGEVGHIRLAEEGPVGFNKAGSFEGFCGGSGIAKLAKLRVRQWTEEGRKVPFCSSPENIDDLTAKSVAEAARGGDRYAIEIYEEVGHRLGQGLSVLIDALNPELIVLGSIFVRDERLLRGPMEAVIKEEALDFSRKVCRVVPAKLGEDLGYYSSLVVAMMGSKKKR